MSDKHTPAPWVPEAGGGRGSWVAGSNGEWAALSCGDTDETAEANARLIAAAPEMLEALRFVYPRLDALPDALRLEAERAVSAAIAKATGEAA